MQAGAGFRDLRRWSLIAVIGVVLAAGLGLSGRVATAGPQARSTITSCGGSGPRALIDATTVTGGCSSLEAAQALGLGFKVDLATTWIGVTASQFAAYQVLIVGDPSCFVLSASTTGSAATWAPVVMGTSPTSRPPGNRIVIGTDVVFHNGAHPTNIHLIEDGIEYAGASAGSTGVYFDTSCVQGGAPGIAVSGILTMLSDPSASGSWSTFNPPCAGTVSLIARDPAFSTSGTDLALTTTDLSSWSCSVHESFPTFKSDWNPLAIATDPSLPSHPTCGSDPDTGVSACGQAYILIAGIGTPIDHFKCYVSKKPIVVHPAVSSIQLQDQFDGSRFEKAKVVHLYRFCNPVQKQHGHTVTPILHKQLHLAIYSITAHPTVNHKVVLRNQFGTQTISVGSPSWLAVPTSKNSHAQPDPTALNHFKCYPVLHSKPVNVIVTLTDQWHVEPKVKVGRPLIFCNPTLKVHGHKTFPLVNTVAHLACYQLAAKPFTKSAHILNQFTNATLTVTGADLLCVPSVKLAYSPVHTSPVKTPSPLTAETLSLSCPREGKAKRPLPYSGTLSPPVSGARISITWETTTQSDSQDSSAAANDAGAFSGNFTPGSPGTWIGRAQYTGDAKHTQAQSAVCTFNVG